MTEPQDLIDGRLDDQLRAAGDEWRAARPARSTSVDPMLFAAARAPRSNRALAGVAGVIVIALIAVLIIVALPPRDPRIATSSPSPSTSPSSQPSASSSPDFTSAPPSVTNLPTWTEVPASQLPAADDGRLRIGVQNGRFVATGTRCDGARCAYVLSESSDGESWQEVASITPDVGNLHGALQIIHDDRYGFVAAANQPYEGLGAGLWHSADGQHWDWLGDQAVFDGSECTAGQYDSTDLIVSTIADRLIATGHVFCGGLIVPATWTSTDGITWQRAEPAPVQAVIAGESGYVGVGQDGLALALWHSSEGLIWERAALPPAAISVASVASGFVAASMPTDLNGPTQLYSSQDGSAWSGVGMSFPAHAQPLVSDGVRAVFAEYAPKGSKGLQVSSSDGRSWARYEIPSDSNIDGSAILGDRVIAWSGTQAWVADISEMPSPRPSPTASPSPSGDSVWRVLQPADLPDIDGFFGLRVQDGRFLADAYSCAEGNFSDQVACDGERMLLASDDGVTWTELARMDGGPFISHFFAGDGYFLASAFFGAPADDLGPWYSTDGQTWESLAGQPGFDSDGCGSETVHQIYFAPMQLPDGSLRASGMLFCDTRLPSIAWTSSNGHDWTEADPLPVDSVAVGHGVLVGSDGNNLWHSPDGIDWQKGQTLEGPFYAAPVASGFVGLTSDNSFTAAKNVVYTTADGIEWAEQPQIFHDLQLKTLNSDGNRAVTRDNSDFDPTSGIWVSTPDGASWTRHALPFQDAAGPDYVAISGDRVVALGHATVRGQDVPMAWVADIPL